jgi:hypothetical protein
MFDLVYNKLPRYENEFGCTITVCGGDTDSLFLTVAGKVDLIKQMYPSMIRDGLLDTSNYAPNHPLYSKQYMAQLGCIKDEFKGGICKEIVMLAPKCYSMELLDGERKATAKGVGRSVRKRLSHADYKERYLTKTELSRKLRRIQSFNHVIYNVQQEKIALSFFENKRAWTGNNYSVPYGHYSIRN